MAHRFAAHPVRPLMPILLDTLPKSLDTLECLRPASPAASIRAYYRVLSRTYGPQHWWPGHTRFEVILGAYLVQNTSWANADRALRQLRANRKLSLSGIRSLSLRKLETFIRPAGFFRQKARSLKNFVALVDQSYGGSLQRMFARPPDKLRRELLQLNGVGPETADSILLYAGQAPFFVVDAYARRVFERHGVIAPGASYEDVRRLVEGSLGRERADGACSSTSPPPHDPSPMSRARRSATVQVYNEMHALMVAVGKSHCLRTAPRCERCPLQRFLPSPGGNPVQHLESHRERGI